MSREKRISGEFYEGIHSAASNASTQAELVARPIANCFSKAGFCDRNGETDELEHILDDLPVSRDEFLQVVQADDTCECHGIMTDAEICAEFRGNHESDGENESTPDDTEEQPPQPVSLADAFDHLEGLRSFLDQQPDGAAAMPKLYELEKAVARLRKPKLKQRTIDDFLH